MSRIDKMLVYLTKPGIFEDFIFNKNAKPENYVNQLKSNVLLYYTLRGWPPICVSRYINHMSYK